MRKKMVIFLIMSFVVAFVALSVNMHLHSYGDESEYYDSDESEYYDGDESEYYNDDDESEYYSSDESVSVDYFSLETQREFSTGRTELLDELTFQLLETTGLKSYDKEFIVLLMHEVNKFNDMYFALSGFDVVNYDSMRQSRAVIACCAEMSISTIRVEEYTDWFNPHPHPGRWIREIEIKTRHICQNCGTVHG